MAYQALAIDFMFSIQMFNQVILLGKCGFTLCTGKSLLEALILASTNQQYGKRLFIDLPVHYMKIASLEHGENMGRTWVEHE